MWKATENKAAIWFAPVERAAPFIAIHDFESLLDEEESRRYRRFRFPEHARLFLVAHALLRTTLSRYAPVPPRNWQFQYGSHGRPEITDEGNSDRLRFNLSHTEGLAACCLTRDVTIGIDVEFLGRRNQTLPIAKRYFSSYEFAQLSALPAEQQHHRFLEYWTLKESFVKACGGGLSIPLDSFSFIRQSAGDWRVDFHADCHGDPTLWQFVSLCPTPSHVLAVAIRRSDHRPFEIAVHEMDWANGMDGNASQPCSIVSPITHERPSH